MRRRSQSFASSDVLGTVLTNMFSLATQGPDDPNSPVERPSAADDYLLQPEEDCGHGLP